MTSYDIRALMRGDLPALRDLLNTIDLFPAEMLEALSAPFLGGEETHVWLVAEHEGQVCGLCFAETEPMTDGTWNMRALGVRADRQRHGVASRLVAQLEARLRDGGQRLLVVDTASGEALAPARAFYAREGYAAEACIRSFWADGEDKLSYTKTL